MPTYKNIFKYTTVEYTEEAVKYLMCHLLVDVGDSGSGEYFDEIHLDEDTGTLKFFYDDVEIKDNAPCMTKYIVKNID